MRWLLLLLPTGCFSIPKENLDDWPCLVRGECDDETGQPGPDDSDTGDSDTGQPDSPHTAESGADTGDSTHTGDSTAGGDTASPTRYYRDGDADGYGDPNLYVDAYARPGTWVTEGTDCDDDDATRYPGAPEVCEDGQDNDCDDTTDPDAGCRLEGEHTLEDADWTLLGEEYGDYAGGSVGDAGDIDGDGAPDLLIGAPASGYVGAIYIWMGSSGTGGDLADAPLRIQAPDVGVGDYTYYYLASYGEGSMGDLDADGLADIFYRFGYFFSNVGIAYGSTLLDAMGSPSGELSAADSDILLPADGYAAPLGDMDGDELPELGACDLSTGEVGIYLGADLVLEGSSARPTWRGQSSSTYAATAYPYCVVAPVPGLGTDGLAGMIAGLPWEDPGGKTDAGIAYVLDEIPDADGTLASQAIAIRGSEAGTYIGGYGVAGLGDLDGDGEQDIGVVSAGSEPGLYVFFGAPTVNTSVSAADVFVTDAFRPASPSVGDVDGDGQDDLLAASGQTEGYEDILVYGPLAGGVIDVADVRFTDGIEWNTGPAAPGDVDLDGRADILIGNLLESTVGLYAGAAYLYTGSAF